MDPDLNYVQVIVASKNANIKKGDPYSHNARARHSSSPHARATPLSNMHASTLASRVSSQELARPMSRSAAGVFLPSETHVCLVLLMNQSEQIAMWTQLSSSLLEWTGSREEHRCQNLGKHSLRSQRNPNRGFRVYSFGPSRIASRLPLDWAQLQLDGSCRRGIRTAV